MLNQAGKMSILTSIAPCNSQNSDYFQFQSAHPCSRPCRQSERILHMTIRLHPLCLECAAKSAFRSNSKQRYRNSLFNHRNRPSFSLPDNIRFGADMFEKGFETGVGLQRFFVLGHRRYKCFTADHDQLFTRSGDGDIKALGVV
jgi:hypothetical protein